MAFFVLYQVDNCQDRRKVISLTLLVNYPGLSRR